MRTYITLLAVGLLALLLAGCGDKAIVTREGDGSRLNGRDPQTGQPVKPANEGGSGAKSSRGVDADGNRGG